MKLLLIGLSLLMLPGCIIGVAPSKTGTACAPIMDPNGMFKQHGTYWRCYVSEDPIIINGVPINGVRQGNCVELNVKGGDK